MCWNTEVSIGAGLVHLLTYQQVVRHRPAGWKGYALFTLFYAAMEFLQAGQWVILNRCPNSGWNPSSTFGAYILIWFQPLLYVLIGVRTERVSFRYQYPFVLTTITFLVAIGNVILSLWSGRSIAIPGTNYGSSLHTQAGPQGHLLWQFPIYSLNYQPTYFVYLTTIILTLFLYQIVVMRNILFLGWLGTLVMSVMLIGNGSEVPSFWCLLSVLVDIPILWLCHRG